MGEDADPLTTDSNTKPPSSREILAIMAVIVLVVAVCGLVFGSVRFGVGVLIGGVLALANYIWLDRSTRAIFENTGVSSAGWLAAKYVLRYVVIGAVLLTIYLIDVLPVAAVIAGLGAFAVAVVIQGLKTIFKS